MVAPGESSAGKGGDSRPSIGDNQDEIDNYDDDDAAFEASVDAAEYPAIYVAGYLVLYGKDASGELALTREDVRAAIPPPSPLPINIDHRHNCTVGVVLALADDETGLFFLGKIRCPLMATMLAAAASSEIFGESRDRLDPAEKLLYLVTNYLPSASLSSRRLAPGETPDETFLAHVALCLLGRRVGTIVTYDTSAHQAVAPFRLLGAASRRRLLADAEETENALAADATWNPSEKALSRALLGTAVNNMLLRDRWRLVAERRRQAGISGHRYLQASARAKLEVGASDGAEGGTESAREEDPDGETAASDGLQKRRVDPGDAISHQAEGFCSHTAPGVGRGPSEDPKHASAPDDFSSEPVPTNAESAEIAMSVPSGPSPPGEDFLWVPVSCYNQLIAGHNPTASRQGVAQDDKTTGGPAGHPAQQQAVLGQAPFAPQHPIPVYYAPYGPPSAPHYGPGPYWPGSQVTQPPSIFAAPQHAHPQDGRRLENRIAALLDAMENDRFSGSRSAGPQGRGGGDDGPAGGYGGQPSYYGGDRGQGGGPLGSSQARRGRKRQHDWDARPDSAEPYYPGEGYPPERGEPPLSTYRGDGGTAAYPRRQYDGDDGYHRRIRMGGGGGQDETLAGLMGAVTSLQREVERLRGGGVPTAAGATPGHPHPPHAQYPHPQAQGAMGGDAYGMATYGRPPQAAGPYPPQHHGQAAPLNWTTQTDCCGTVAPTAQQQVAFGQIASGGTHVGPAPAQQVVQEPAAAASSSGVAAAHAGQTTGKPSGANEQSAVTTVQQPLASDGTPAPSASATVDASAVAALGCRRETAAGRTYDLEADAFVSQMMGGR
uniref:Capsid scaffolding protein n=1 Tax=Anatid alphaherpesvirus 2 TaxID=3080522 RepID=A0AAU0K886_9ALPH